jgi:hypothetical protein
VTRTEVALAVNQEVALDVTLDVAAVAETNLMNQANVLNVNAVAGPDFGTPVAYFPGREIQVGVRYLFGR